MRNMAYMGLLVLLAGCSLNPDLQMPRAPVADTFAGAAPQAEPSAATLPWQKIFAEPRLQRLIESALENNRDLRIALLNSEAVRAQYRIQRSTLLPSIEGTASFTRQKTAGSTSGSSALTNQYSAGAALSAFEIDLFGRLRSQSESAFERYLATSEGAQAARASLISAVVDAYLAERLAVEQLALSEKTAANWQASLDLAQQLRSAEQNSQLDVEQATGLVRQAEADLQGRKRALAQAQHALTLLVGTTIPDALPAPGPFMDMAIMTQLPAGLPSDLLMHRADIRQAEHELIAANADIGAARAAFFPRLTLTTAFGVANPALGALFDNQTQVWSFAPQITQPLFQGGRLIGELDLAEIRKDIRIQEYEKSIQAAFREVCDGLASRATYGQQIKSQQAVVASAERRQTLSQLRYEAGLDSRLDYLDAQRSLYTAQQTLLDLKKEDYSSAASLYKALGGGRETLPP